jgi:hypothetical protein
MDHVMHEQEFPDINIGAVLDSTDIGMTNAGED